MNMKRSIRAIIAVSIVGAIAAAMTAMANTADTSVEAREEAIRVTQEAAKEPPTIIVMDTVKKPVPTEPAKPTEPAEPEPVETLPEEPDWYYPSVDLSEEMQHFIFVQTGEAAIDYELVLAIIMHESNCDPDAISATNDYGLMQINEINLPEMRKYGLTDMLDPQQNVTAGITILTQLADRFGHGEENMVRVLMAYNMGPSGAADAWERGVHRTDYTDTIMGIRDSLVNQG